MSAISSPHVITPNPLLGKVLKVPIFRLAMGHDLVTRVIICAFKVFISICSFSLSFFKGFDAQRAEKSLERFIALGATNHFITPKDGLGKIQMMQLKAEDLEDRIHALGGKWEKTTCDTQHVFAIIPPKRPSASWHEFKEMLSHFHWKEENGMIITSKTCLADTDQALPKCFLYTHTTSSCFTSDWKRAGFYLGAKQDICFFDNGNIWKNTNRPVTEESFYLEIEAVYDQIKDQYRAQDLWLCASCGGGPVAAHLKRKLHNKGVNFVLEQGFINLEDFSQPFQSFITPRLKGILNAKNPSDHDLVHHFSIESLWSSLPKYSGLNEGKVINVYVKHDEFIKEDDSLKFFNLAKRVNQSVYQIVFESNKKCRHMDDFFFYQKPAQRFWELVFEKPELDV